MNLKLNAQDAVHLIDRLVELRVEEATSSVDSSWLEEVALVKRDLADYFLSIDTRKGILVKGDND